MLEKDINIDNNYDYTDKNVLTGFLFGLLLVTPIWLAIFLIVKYFL